MLLVAAGASDLAARATAVQASERAAPVAGGLGAGGFHTCAVLGDASLRCWGFGAAGQLGYANTAAIGDDETPASVGPVGLAGHGVRAIATGAAHTCALLDDGTVRCWGFGGNGRLGYANLNSVSDPASVGPVDLGASRTAVAISAGKDHTCALLDDGSVRCWGFGGTGPEGVSNDGRLGYGNNDNIGDDETPGSVGPVKLGGRAIAISAGGDHTCALLDNGEVRCWGVGLSGQLGYGNRNSVGATSTTTPDRAGPVSLGGPAAAITSGGSHTCAILRADGSVRCWGEAGGGQLGYGNRVNIGDDETPDQAGPVALGLGRSAVAISAGTYHTCAVLDDASVRCWGLGASGRLGYANQDNIGDDLNETPASAGPVDLGGPAVAISAGGDHTCARLAGGTVRCWGYGAEGQLGYCNQNSIGDDEAPGTAGPVNLQPGDGGAGCPGSAGPPVSGAPAAPDGVPGQVPGAATAPADHATAALAAQRARARALRMCLRGMSRQVRIQRRRARRRSGGTRSIALRHIAERANRERTRCLDRYGRTPGRVRGLNARGLSTTTIALGFDAAGTDGTLPPGARSYLVKQSRRPIRTLGAFRRARSLCEGSCFFPTVLDVGQRVSLIVTDLQPHTTYYYAVAARDNVSCRLGPRSRPVNATTTATDPPPEPAVPHPPAVRPPTDPCKR